jgi:alkylhydroperoxidase/carboxymuconolactone decarboxylase family protein YurZ/ketosteroid isomerase-like protein
VAQDPARTLFDYFDRIDAQDPVGAVANFTEDASAEVMTGKFLVGRDKIGRALARILVAYERTSHHATNLRIDDDGDRVLLWSYVYAYHRMKATGATWHLWIRLRDVLVRQPDGNLLIAEHQLVGVDSVPGRQDIPSEWYPGHPGREWETLPAPGQRLDEAIGTASPAASEGMALIARAAREGALAGGRAALVTACAAASRGQDDVVLDALASAKAAALPGAEAWAAPAVVLISRGTAAARRLARGLLEVYGAPPEGPASPGAPDEVDALDYFRDYFGEVPERVSELAARSPAAFGGYALLHRSALRECALPPVLVELLLCGINAAELQPEFVRIHADAARRVGAGDDEVLGAVLAAIPVSGVAVWATAAPALSAAPAR